MFTRQGRSAQLNHTKPSRSRRHRVVLAAVTAAVVGLAFASSPVFAASTHPFKEEWSVGEKCTPRDVATDTAGNVYVACEAVGANGYAGAIRKFSPTGAPISFSAPVPYVSGNEINEDPNNSFEGIHQIGPNSMIAVDKSSARPGYIYLSANQAFGSSSQSIEVFAPSGEYETSIQGEFFTGEAGGVGLDQNGFIYAVWDGCCGRAHISKYDPQNFHELRRLVPYKGPFGQEPFHGPCCTGIAPDNSGAVWVGWGGPLFDGSEWFGKWEADQLTTNIKAGEKDPTTVVGTPSPYLAEAFSTPCPETQFLNAGSFQCSLKGRTFDVDLGNNDVYADEGSKIVPYSNGVAGDPVHQDGPAFGEGKLGSSRGIDIAADGTVTAALPSANKVVRFEKGATLPTVTTKIESANDIGHVTATVRGVIDPVGAGEITACKVKWGETTAYTGGTSPVTCTEPTNYPNGSPTEVSAPLTGLTVGKTYHFRFEASNAAGSNFGGDRSFEAKAVLKLETKPATGVDENNVTLQGQLDTDGLATTYLYEYGRTTSYGLKTASTPIAGLAGEIKQTPAALGHLQPGLTYHYRLVATNSLGTTKGKDVTVRTASPPEISGVGVENVTDTSADLFATINAVGYETTYLFEYGASSSYGQSLPLSGNELTGNTPQLRTVHLSGLPSTTTIHYRVVATNEWGTSATDDTTFNFRPPDCPNAHVRQVTGSSYLPDCRAYELVTPGYAGAVQIMPGEGFVKFAEVFGGNNFAQAPQNFGRANSPPRFSYWGALGSVKGIDAPNTLIDVYMSTRTTSGWVTTMPGLKGNETKYTYGRSCSDKMDLCVDHIGPLYVQNAETHEFENVEKSASPFLYKSDGTRLGRLPTNVGVVKDGTKYVGDQQLSGDFSHYVFSTQTKFAPEGLSTPPGSVYDNDVGAKTVQVISKLPNGEDIPRQPSVVSDSTRVTGLAGVSTDGSRVLMAGTTSGYCNVNTFPFECPYILGSPARLYMRVDNAITYEVSRGEEVNFVGMTRDSSKVLFTTTKALLPGKVAGTDNDTSRDLYMWEEDGDHLRLLSQEGDLGNTDKCTATWTTACGVQPLTPSDMNYSQYLDHVARGRGIDDVMADESGDVYFYSPEDLVKGKVGGDGERNLYLYRNGHIHFVATLEPGTTIERVTISEDGSHAAFMTKSSLTAYNSQTHQEVYTYNADNGALRCASCNPAGTPPIGDVVTVSEAGFFMANDGRTFFATKEALVPQDTDGIRDIYEYADGHAQLISSGTGNRESTGGLETISIFFGDLQTSLESVSRDGVDVYYSTFESLVPEDQNGSFLKVYDARSGGGFDFNPDLGPCAAADECHGASSSPPTAAQIGTGGNLGASGNLPAKHHKKKKKRHHKRHGQRHGSQRNG